MYLLEWYTHLSELALGDEGNECYEEENDRRFSTDTREGEKPFRVGWHIEGVKQAESEKTQLLVEITNGLSSYVVCGEAG
jgi:hypothetical protein